MGTAFGVDDILTAPVFTLDANGISQTPDAYGIALALISAQEEMLGQTTEQVMATLSSQMTGDTFSNEAKASLTLAAEGISEVSKINCQNTIGHQSTRGP